MIFHKDKHIQYIKSLDTKKEDYEYWLTEHLRINGTYWGAMALEMMGAKDALDTSSIVSFVLSCRNEDGGFGAFPGHDSSLHSTLSALQLLLIYNSLEEALSKQAQKQVVAFITALQLPDGSFKGDSNLGEIDTRFVYTAIQALAILQSLSDEIVDKAVTFIINCRNFDGGFGMVPGAESHAAQVFTCLATLAICNRLDLVDAELTGWWLSERQLDNGGLNGRPSKLPDVCYSWWVLSSLAILDKLHWINFDSLRDFILDSQDPVNGGISDRPDNQVDVFHTIFGIAGLSLMRFEKLNPVDPIYCLPVSLTTTKIPKWPYK